MASSFPKQFDTVSLDISDPPSAAIQTISMQWNNRGTRLAYSRTDRSLKIVRINTDRGVIGDTHVVQQAHEKPVGSISWDPNDENKFITTARDSIVNFWELKAKTTKLVKSFRMDTEQKCIFLNAKFSRCGKYIAVLDNTYQLSLLSTAQFEILASYQIPQSTVYDFEWNPDSKYIIAACDNGTLKILEIDNDAKFINMVESLQLTNSKLTSIKYSEPMQSLLIIGSNDSQVLIIDPATLTCIQTISEVDESIGTVDLLTTPDDQSFASITYEYGTCAKIVDVVSKEEVHTISSSVYGEYIPLVKFNPSVVGMMAYNGVKGKCFMKLPRKESMGAPARSSSVSSKTSGGTSSISGQPTRALGPAITARSSKWDQHDNKSLLSSQNNDRSLGSRSGNTGVSGASNRPSRTLRDSQSSVSDRDRRYQDMRYRDRDLRDRDPRDRDSRDSNNNTSGSSSRWSSKR